MFKQEKAKKPRNFKFVLATDAGSTTSKARLFIYTKEECRFLVAGEAPTTVEAPFEDVTMGLRNALREIEELIGWKILKDDGTGIIKPTGDNEGVDLYVSTSSAGGGLQMMCAGVISMITTESAQRAALGAGAIVFDVISKDDRREDYEKIERIRQIRPDMILVAGGTDGGTISHVSEIAELIVAAQPKFRLGNFQLPIVYCGNKEARPYIEKLMKDDFELKLVDNIRPIIEVENVGPARDAIQECFMEHVMSHAPGYNKLKGWVDAPIMPTPWGEGRMMQLIAEKYNCNVMGVGLGGATTNVYSIFSGKFNRTVSANLGMSYSICNVLKETGVKNIDRWMPFDLDETELRNRLRNKMIRPTTIPQTMKSLLIEHSLAREALRLGLEHHKTLATELKGVHKEKTISEAFEEREETIVDMMNIEYIVGTGGLLSHAPGRVQAALILIDGFQPEGFTQLCTDSVFMMPHLGILSTVHPKEALEIFEKDCLVHLGTCIAPKGVSKYGQNIGKIKIQMPNNTTIEEEIKFGTIKRIKLQENETAEVEINPRLLYDMGRGGGRKVTKTVSGGVVGLIIDGRGRPIALPSGKERKSRLMEWFSSLNVYPKDILEELTNRGL